MSETMDLGIIQMPFDMAMGDELSRRQFYSRAQAILAERDQLRAEVEALRRLLEDAAEEVESWGSYASEYFQEKHDLAGCAAKYRMAAMAAKEGV